jgi:hypothetical protein
MKNVKIRLPETRLVSVYRNSDPILADLVRDSLEDNGISAVINGERQAGFAGVLPVEVMVRELDASAAMLVIKKLYPSE